MDTQTAIITRRSIRAWKDEKVPDGILNTILEAGRFSPSPLNSQPWRFIVIRNKQTLASLVPTSHHAPFIDKANVLILVTVEKAAKVDAWLAEHEQHTYSAVCAFQNMWLSAWDLGIGGCWVTLDDTTARKKFKIPDDHVIIGGLALGYSIAPPWPHSDSDRKKLKDMVFYEKFGNTEKNS